MREKKEDIFVFTSHTPERCIEVHLISLSDALEIENSYGNQILNIRFNCTATCFYFRPNFLAANASSRSLLSSAVFDRSTKNVVVTLRKFFGFHDRRFRQSGSENLLAEVNSIAFVLNFIASLYYFDECGYANRMHLYHHFIFALIIEGHRKSPVVSFG